MTTASPAPAPPHQVAYLNRDNVSGRPELLLSGDGPA